MEASQTINQVSFDGKSYCNPNDKPEELKEKFIKFMHEAYAEMNKHPSKKK